MKKVHFRYDLAGLLVLGLAFPAGVSAAGIKTFNTPEAAVAAVVQACKGNDTAALLEIFGPDSKEVVESGDPSDDKDNRAKFVLAVEQKKVLVADPMNPDKVFFSIGKNDWPFPIPLVRKDGQWHFDTPDGKMEIIARRIGSNELSAIDICRGYVTAQFEYAQSHRQNGLPVYAQKIVSTPGQQDGLYWEPPKGAPECPIPKGFAKAATGMSIENRAPYHGYYFHILKAQGPDAQGGAISYVVKDSMIGGFALIAWPAEYGVSGVQTFIVNHDGTVYEKTLGPDTASEVEKITEFNPDKTWHPVSVQE
jgi:DUF2950 family protein